MNRLQEIQNKLIKHKQLLFNNYPIKSMAIFGSYARQEQNKESDVDILVDFSGKIGIRFIDLAYELEKIIEKKVDLVTKNSIEKKYLESISSDLIYV